MEEKLGEILIYQTENGLTDIEVKMQDETVWLTQQQLVELYQSSKSNVSEHIKHIFEEGELDEEAVVRKFRTTAEESNSPSSKICLICSLMVDLDFPNKVLNCDCDSHTVSPSNRTSTLIVPSCDWYINISLLLFFSSMLLLLQEILPLFLRIMFDGITESCAGEACSVLFEKVG